MFLLKKKVSFNLTDHGLSRNEIFFSPNQHLNICNLVCR